MLNSCCQRVRHAKARRLIHNDALCTRALPEGEPDPMDFTEKMRTATKADSSASPKDVPHASTQTELYDFCLKKSSGLCVLALLDASSPSFAEHTQIASAAAGRWERQPLQFSWIDAARQVHTFARDQHSPVCLS